jgi:hypothetical protein
MADGPRRVLRTLGLSFVHLVHKDRSLVFVLTAPWRETFTPSVRRKVRANDFPVAVMLGGFRDTSQNLRVAAAPDNYFRGKRRG